MMIFSQLNMTNMYNYFQPNILPPQQVLQANGKTSVDSIRLSPNSSVFVMDTTAPLIWLCVSDSLGNVSAKPYDIKPHEEPKTEEKQGIEERLAALEETIKKMIGERNESNVVTVKQKQNNKSDSTN